MTAATRRIPPLNALRSFEAAARHVSFTKAAEELGVTHGAVSRQVASLEAWFGRPLFRRNRSHLSLTDIGENYLNELVGIFDRLAVASNSVLDQAASTALRISAPPTFTMRWLLPRMPMFQRRRPDVQIGLSTTLLPANFADNRYDLAIRGMPPGPGVESVAFMTEVIVPVCHVDLLGPAASMTDTMLGTQTLISYDTEPHAWSTWLAAAGMAASPRRRLDFEQMFFALQAASEGMGLVLVPLFLVVDDIIAGRLCLPFGLRAATRRQYHASFPASSETAALNRLFCQWLLQEGRATEALTEAWIADAGLSA